MTSQYKNDKMLYKVQKNTLGLGHVGNNEFNRLSHDNNSIDRERQQTKTVLPQQVSMSNYKIQQVLLDSNDRNNAVYPTKFTLKLANSLKNVFAIRLLKSELLYTSSSPSQDGIYLYLNGYKLLMRNEDQDTMALFSRITTGVNDFQCVTTNILNDPYTYILNPIEPKLNRFDIQCFDYNNNVKTDVLFTLVLHLAVFSYC
jgi:hypothetical protein